MAKPGCPVGVQLLLQSSELKMKPHYRMFKTEFRVKSAQVPGVLTIRGNINFKAVDDHDVVIARFKKHQEIFSTSEFEVILGTAPPLTVKLKGALSRSIWVYDEGGRHVLTVKRPFTFTFSLTYQYQILGENDVLIGEVEKRLGVYSLRFPRDLDVRYKAALLAACLYDHIQQRDN